MGGTRCSVANCKNSPSLVKRCGVDIQFFAFPKDEAIKKLWVHRCRRLGTFNTIGARICSVHFAEEDYERNLRAELLGLKRKKTLKKAAVPSLFLGKDPENKEAIENLQKKKERDQRLQKRLNRKIVYELLQKDENSASNDKSVVSNVPMDDESCDTKAELHNLLNLHSQLANALPPEESHSLKQESNSELSNVQVLSKEPHTQSQNLNSQLSDSNSQPNDLNTQLNYLNTRINYLNSQPYDLNSQLNDLHFAPEELHYKCNTKLVQMSKDNLVLMKKLSSMNNKINSMRTRVGQLKAEVKLLKKKQISSSKIHNNIAKAFASIFSVPQQNILLGKKKVAWDGKTFSIAFALRYINKNAYNYIRSTLKYPLPSISSLRRWASTFDTQGGILDDVFKLLEVAATHAKPDYQHIVALGFDEMRVRTVDDYDVKSGETTKLQTRMNIVLARALFDKWKLPLFADFDKVITEEILLHIISKLHKIGYTVIACVSNTREHNIELWKKIGITEEKTWCLHPISGEKIYFFADVPYLLKLMRNSLLNEGFHIGGELVNVDLLMELDLLRSDNKPKEYSKFKVSYIAYEASQYVRHRRELFSDRTAKTLESFKLGSNPEATEKCAALIKQANDWFDVFNSSVPKNPKFPCKNGYGNSLHKDLQNSAIEKFCQTIKTMECIGTTDIQVFQKGVLMSSLALKCLYDDIKSKYSSLDYILTNRFNLDELEVIFSKIRGKCKTTTKSNILCRLKNIILAEMAPLMYPDFNTENQNLLPNGLRNIKVQNIVGNYDENEESNRQVLTVSEKISES